jgi:1-deoxy-D-xylulose-5-phosphate reductoisomerase
VAALTTNRKTDLLEEQARRLTPKFVCAFDEDAAKALKMSLADTDIRVGSRHGGPHGGRRLFRRATAW